MNFTEFVHRVRNRAQISSITEAMVAIRAVLETLTERIGHPAAEKIAAHLPAEVGPLLGGPRAADPMSFPITEFFCRVALRGRCDLPTSAIHVKSVVAVLCEAMPRDEARSQLPANYAGLFEDTDTRRETA